MRRSGLAVVLSVSLFVAPLAGEAQPAGKVSRIGYLSSASSNPPNELAHLRQGLKDLGYAEGRNVLIDARFAENKLDKLPELAVDLMSLKPGVFVTFSTPAAKAASQATRTIPIVMSSGADPVGLGLVTSLRHPGGNVTGLTHLAGPEMWEKVLEFLKESVPTVSRIGILRNSAILPEARGVENLARVAGAHGLSLLPVELRSVEEFSVAFAALIRKRIDARVAFESPFNVQHRRTITEFAIEKRLPTAFGQRVFVEAGGLISYGTSLDKLSYQAATFVDKILKGAKPSDLPIERPTKFELVINLKTAKALSLTIPQSLLVRADEVLQ